MAITFVATANGGTGSTTSFSIPFPNGIAVGDLLILEFTHRGIGNGTFSGNGGTGWTHRHKRFYGTGSPQDFTGHCYYRFVGATDLGSPNPVVTVSALVNASAGILTVYRGAGSLGSPTEPITLLTGEENASGNETHAAITTTVFNSWVVLVVVNTPDLTVTSGSCTDPGALTERASALSTGGTDASISHWSREKTTAPGTTGAFTWAQTDAVSGSWVYAITPILTAITGTGAVVEARDTTSASGGVAVTGTGALREAADSSDGSGGIEIPSGPHAPGPIARLTQFAIGSSKYGSFAGKEPSGGEPPGAITGAAAIAEAADVLQAAATVAIAAAGALLEAPDRLESAASGALTAAGQLVEAADRLASSGSVSVTGTALLQEAADSLSGATTVAVAAVGALVEAADLILAQGGVPVVVTRKGRLAQFAVGVKDYPGFQAKSAASEQAITGSGQLVEAADRITSDGTLAAFDHNPGHITRAGQYGVGLTKYAGFTPKSGSITATGAIQEAADALAAAGSVAIAAAGALRQAADQILGSGAVTVAGAGALREAADYIAADGGSASFGNAALLERADRVSSAGAVLITGTGELLEANDRTTGTGTGPVTGTGLLREAGDAVSSTGAVQVAGTGALREQNDRISGAAVSANIIGTGNLREAPDTIEATGIGGFPASITGADGRRHSATGSDGRRHGVSGSDSRSGRITSSDGI